MNTKSTPIRLSILILVTFLMSGLNEWRKSIRDDANGNEKQMKYFPAETAEADGFYFVRVSSNSNSHFQALFTRQQISGNGYAWKRILHGVIAQNTPELLEFVEFDPEEKYCFISCSNRETMQKVAELIHQHCASEDSLAKVILQIEENELFVKLD